MRTERELGLRFVWFVAGVLEEKGFRINGFVERRVSRKDEAHIGFLERPIDRMPDQMGKGIIVNYPFLIRRLAQSF
ncbi:hypothetical protein L1887_33616 [Cichorium endivia]|nr:hypothetical protein L1887_33616 [Cichorium endivia]